MRQLTPLVGDDALLSAELAHALGIPPAAGGGHAWHLSRAGLDVSLKSELTIRRDRETLKSRADDLTARLDPRKKKLPHNERPIVPPLAAFGRGVFWTAQRILQCADVFALFKVASMISASAEPTSLPAAVQHYVEKRAAFLNLVKANHHPGSSACRYYGTVLLS